MLEIIDTDQYKDDFNKSCKDEYCIKQGNYCKFNIKPEDKQQLQSTCMLMFKPIYNKERHKKEIFSYNEALKGHTYHDFSEIEDFIKVTEIDEITDVLKNASFKEYLLSIPRNFRFYIDIDNEPCYEAMFVENRAYLYENGSIGRKVKILYCYLSSDNKKHKRKPKVNQRIEKVRTHNFTLDKDMNHISSYPIKKLSKVSNDPFCFFDRYGSVRNIQLLKGANNHVSRGHDVVNKNVLFTLYHKDSHKYSQIQMVVHYCEKCRNYFDFYDSFIAQLKQEKIDYRDLLVNYFDDNNRSIKFGELNMREYSKLRLFGYSVDANKLNDDKRHALLRKIIEERFMSPVEIKNHLEFLIRYQGKRISRIHAKDIWIKDIQYINDLLRIGIK